MDKAIEYIDIGGPSMLRAAAKTIKISYHYVILISIKILLHLLIIMTVFLVNLIEKIMH